MRAIDQTAWEVLNATADDWENLEQIYLAVSRAVSETGGVPGRGAPRLAEVADRVSELTEAGLLEAREEGGRPVSALGDGRYVWRAWFRMTPAGRQAWSGSEWADLTRRGAHS